MLCSLAPPQQVKLNGHSRLGWRGLILLCNTSKKKRLKPASFSDQCDSWPGFSTGNLEPQSISENSYRLPGQEWPDPSVGTVTYGESKGLWGALNVQSKNLIFSFFCCAVRLSAAISVLLLLFVEGWCELMQLEDLLVPGISIINRSREEHLEMMLSFLVFSFCLVLERASLLGNSKPSRIRSWLGIWEHGFLGAF